MLQIQINQYDTTRNLMHVIKVCADNGRVVFQFLKTVGVDLVCTRRVNDKKYLFYRFRLFSQGGKNASGALHGVLGES